MLSILIPVYNYDVTKLVQELHKQLVTSKIDFEIICIDDVSKQDIINSNLRTEKLSNTTYILSNKNNGIAITRQNLIDTAKYDWIILIDADVELIDDNYISNYINVANNDFSFIFGGFAYKKIKPENTHLLRWKYGKKHEAVSASKRNSNPYKITIAANMLAKKDSYKNLHLNSLGNNYAMDYFFGAQLKENNEEVLHIDNQVYHLGIESSITYLRKKERAVETLLKLYNSRKIKSHSNSLLKTFIFLKKSKLNYIGSWWFSLFNKSMRKNLTSKNPYIKLLQLYKLSYLCNIDFKGSY